jgi:tetratricopeptide (TPR) repeat protein
MQDEFLPDEFVLDDVPENGHGPSVVFAGPSDAPPALRAPPTAPPRSAHGHAHYTVLAASLAAAVACAAIVAATRHRQQTREIQTMAVEKVEASSARTAESSAPPAVMPSASASADAAEQAAEEEKAAKRDAEAALEKGHTAQAIEAGERAAALDPTDAEAWLILGAGYDQRGAYAQARRCFASCAREATHGPRRECAALLR